MVKTPYLYCLQIPFLCCILPIIRLAVILKWLNYKGL